MLLQHERTIYACKIRVLYRILQARTVFISLLTFMRYFLNNLKWLLWYTRASNILLSLRSVSLHPRDAPKIPRVSGWLYVLVNDYSYKHTRLHKNAREEGWKTRPGVLINSWLDAEGMENVGFKLLVDHAEKWMFIKSKEEKKKWKRRRVTRTITEGKWSYFCENPGREDCTPSISMIREILRSFSHTTEIAQCECPCARSVPIIWIY